MEDGEKCVADDTTGGPRYAPTMHPRDPSVEPCLFVIFGGTGDLARRKLLPALARLCQSGRTHPQTRVVGVGLEASDDERYRSSIHASLIEHRVDEIAAANLLERLHYAQVEAGGPLHGLRERLDTLAKDHDLGAARAFYLALPPSAFGPTIERLGEAGLNQAEQGFRRIVVEKPFGRDGASARALNQTLHQHFDESQIYRIDHYLGKDTVQNLLTYRFANAMIESSWNRDRVDSVQITVGESLGVGSRASYYDKAGALRDMVQNHLMQLLTLVAMEPPTTFAAAPIRREKIKVLESIAPIGPGDIVRGRYTKGAIDGRPVAGYLEEDGVPTDSVTETFVALRMFIDNWRWKDVPFYLRTGKRMPRKTSQIAIRFKDAPVRFFESMGVTRDTSDILLITLQPSEGFTFHLDIKVPGEPFELRRIPMRFAYADMNKPIPDAYDTLLLDVMEGDQTLFVHAEETERSWSIFESLLDPRTAPENYPAGSWGPPSARDFAIPEERIWQTRPTHLPPGGH